jgi:hypothetical protein
MRGPRALDAVEAGYRHQLRNAIARDLRDGPIREVTAVVVLLENFRAANGCTRIQVDRGLK